MYQALNQAGVAAIQSIFVADGTQRHPYGMPIDAFDPYWGGGRFVYCRATAAIRQFGLVSINCAFDSTNKLWKWQATELANTANLGRTVGVAMSAAATDDFIWVCVQGLVPVNCTASVAADTAFGVVAAGQGGAIANGKQICNARVAAPATTTVAKANSIGASGSYQIKVSDTDGWFIGAYLSGTGVGADAKITKIDSDKKTVTVDVANSAAISGTVTATYNNSTIYYNVVQLNNPFAQGQVS